MFVFTWQDVVLAILLVGAAAIAGLIFGWYFIGEMMRGFKRWKENDHD